MPAGPATPMSALDPAVGGRHVPLTHRVPKRRTSPCWSAGVGFGARPTRLAGAFSPLLILLACASGGAQANMITAPELSRSRAANAYDAIRRVRPEMLRNRDAGGLLFFQPRSAALAVDAV